jgi:hypothetical protein
MAASVDMSDDGTYYLQRAEAELALAQAASHLAAVRAHYHLAGHYLDHAYAGGIQKLPSNFSVKPEAEEGPVGL